MIHPGERKADTLTENKKILRGNVGKKSNTGRKMAITLTFSHLMYTHSKTLYNFVAPRSANQKLICPNEHACMEPKLNT